jgi:hypothetical protein|tara:strand:+ start:583 stop:828 length:246 start_codon:yes stop_codon:yes gene_type:complete
MGALKMSVKKNNELVNTPANHVHISNVGSLTLAEIMNMDNEGYFDNPDLIDNLFYYLCDCKSIREKMNYNWNLDKEENHDS